MIRRHLLFAATAWALPTAAWAAGPLNLDSRGVAIKGHDPLAHFVDGKPMPGRAELSYSVGGATYWFANDRNLQAFKAEPAKYLPQYGGYCAYGVAQGFKPDIDPTAFRIVEGKLYLNLSPAVQTRWLADVPGFITRANENWSQLTATALADRRVEVLSSTRLDWAADLHRLERELARRGLDVKSAS